LIYLIISILYILILLFSFLFSGVETGFLSLNREKYYSELRLKNKNAFRLKKFVDNPDQMLGMTLCGNNLANVAIIEMGSIIAFYGFMNKKYLLAYILSTTVLLFLFGEVLPKIVFRSYSNAILFFISSILRFFKILFAPLIFLVIKFSNILLLPVLNNKKREVFSRKDFINILADTYEEGLLDEEEIHFFETVSSLSRMKVVEVMNPLVDLFLVNKNQNLTPVMKQIKKYNYNIIPVYDGRIDNLVGYVDLIDVFNSQKKKKMVSDFLIETRYVPETNTLDKVYNIFSSLHKKMLIIVDEYGGCCGVIKRDDIVKRIFGFEYSLHKEHKYKKITKLRDNIFEVDTSYDIDDLNKRLGLSIPKDGYETLGGFINSICSSIPSRGELIHWKNLKIRILVASRTAVDKVKIEVKRTGSGKRI